MEVDLSWNILIEVEYGLPSLAEFDWSLLSLLRLTEVDWGWQMLADV